MRIVIATGIFPPDIGGPATYVDKLSGELAKLGFDVRIITYSDPENLELKAKPKVKIKRISRRLPKAIRHLLYFFELLKLALRADLIYAQNLTSAGIPAILASKILRKRLVVKIVGDFVWERGSREGWISTTIEEFQKVQSLKVSFLQKVQSVLAKHADTIIVPSQYLKTRVVSWGVPEEKIEVVYNAPEKLPDLVIPKEEAKRKIGLEGKVILSVGRLAPLKGFSALIEIVKELGPEFKLVIVGEGEEREDLELKIKSLGLERSVKLAGKVPHKELSLFFKAADIFVLNSAYEGLSHVILEAMDQKVPIVATNVGGNPELIENGVNGFLVEYNNKSQIKEAIIKIINDEALSLRFIEESKRRLTQFTWDNLVKETVKVLKGKKRVLFIGVTQYDLSRAAHLKKKFEGLSRAIEAYVLAKGKLSYKKIWETQFYLLPSSFLFWPLALLLSCYICFAKKIDVIVAQSPLLEGFLGAILKKVFRSELIVEIHGDWLAGPFLSKKRKFAFLEKRAAPFIAKFSFRNADKIRGVAEYLVKEVRRLFPEKSYFTFPTFTDLDAFLQEKDIAFEKFILFVGRAQKVKGVEYLKDAFAKIEKDFPDFKLVLVGEGLPEGKLSLAEVKEMMRRCYCLVVPSLSEGLPRVILEAQALGKPVIASKVGGIPDLIKDGENGFLVEPKNVEELAEKLRVLLINEDLAVEMGKRGREFVKNNFSNEKYIYSYIQMIEAS